jgi:hypothetical protein
MTAPKKVAKSLKSLLEDPMVLNTLNRNSDIMPVAEEAVGFWSYDLLNRKPSPAYNEYGLFQGTDLDLACFMYSISERGAVINIPRYKGMRQKRQRVDQVVTSAENRHGKITGVQANKDFWTFSVNVYDENVVSADKVGDYRTFTLTDLNGAWYPGWDRIEFVPTLNENKFITENKLWSGNTIVFRNMIHPNRWTSFFGRHYVISKMIIERLTEESAFLNSEIKAILAAGINFPSDSDGPKSYEYGEKGDTKSVKVTSFQSELFMPDTKYVGTYPTIPRTQAGLVDAYQTRLQYQRLIKKLRFMTRATEYAHSIAPDRIPAWIKGVKWEPGFKTSTRSRTIWERFPLFQDKVGEHSISLLRRWTEKSARVAADY